MWTFGLESSHEGPSLLPGQGGYLRELSQAGLWPQRTEGERLYQNLRPFHLLLAFQPHEAVPSCLVVSHRL